jgi:RNA polymerase sigma-70 factor (ECF subfamily)
MDASMAVIDGRPTVEAVYRAQADRLWRAIFAWSGEHDVASEAVAEAFAQLLRRGPAVRDPAAWAWRTAFRVAAGAMKTRRSAPERVFLERLGSPGQPEPAAPDRYGDPDLFAALRRLSDGQRAAVILFYYADLPIAAIADRLGSDQLAVRANLSRGRRRLRQLLGDDHG